MWSNRNLYGITTKMCLNTYKRDELVHRISDAARQMNDAFYAKWHSMAKWVGMCSQNEGQSWTLDWTIHKLSLSFQQTLIIPVQIILNLKCSKLHNNQDQPYVHTNFWLGMASTINPLLPTWSQQTPYIQNTVWNLQRNWKWEWKLKIMNKYEALSTSLSFF
jgi:hypothetical protein